MTELIWDHRLDELGVHVKRATGNVSVHYELVSGAYIEPELAGGKHEVQYLVIDAQGEPLYGEPCTMDWLERNPQEDLPAKAMTDQAGLAHLELWSILRLDKLDGPYFAYIGNDIARSDAVYGLGNPENRYAIFRFEWHRVTGVPPEPEPIPEFESLTDAAYYFARARPWMPVNDTAALYKFAQAHDLGMPQTDEYEFQFADVTYVGQVFNNGILYVRKGDWTNIVMLSKVRP